jgi:hypothetical protein
MRHRCRNPKVRFYRHYGGRGITVCDRWDDFAAFYADMGPRPSPNHSIDRIDNDGPYSPENCRWATAVEQANNQRRTPRFTFRGETLSLKEWSRRTGLGYPMLLYRWRAQWDAAKALTTPSYRGRP